MNTQELSELVKEEAASLKTQATEYELLNLKFKKLNPNDLRFCIYGQMTGLCTDKRAIELINLCAKRICHKPGDGTEITNSIINGKRILKTGLSGRCDDSMSGSFYSPIEVFIYFKDNKTNGNNEMLIQYLRGEIEELNFKPFTE